MTMPAKIWIRSLSPSTTRVCTRTPSPILNFVASVLNCSFSIASMILFIMSPPGVAGGADTVKQGGANCNRLFLPAHDHDHDHDHALSPQTRIRSKSKNGGSRAG